MVIIRWDRVHESALQARAGTAGGSLRASLFRNPAGIRDRAFTVLRWLLIREGRHRIRRFDIRWSVSRVPRPLDMSAYREPFRLHFGPGPGWDKPDDRWIAIDVDPDRADLPMDFGDFEGLPLPDESCDAIYASHILEHISIWKSQSVLNECARVLAPGGVFRIVIPDVERSIREYVDRNTNYELFKRQRARSETLWKQDGYTLFDSLREDFISKTAQPHLLSSDGLAHQNAWDYETIARDLRQAGFRNVSRASFQQSVSDAFEFEGSYPSEANESYRSLYVEATR